MGSSVGLILGASVFAIVSLLPDEQFNSWGWRIPFLLSAVLVVVGLLIRTSLSESPEFSQVRQDSRNASMPLVEVLRRSPRNVIVGIGAISCTEVSFYVVTVFGQFYATTTLVFTKTEILLGVIIAAAAAAIAVLIAARTADRIGARPIGIVGAIEIAVSTFRSSSP